MSERIVRADGRRKGEVFIHRNGRLCWRRPNGGVEMFPRDAGDADVIAFIARVCRAERVDLNITI